MLVTNSAKWVQQPWCNRQGSSKEDLVWMRQKVLSARLLLCCPLKTWCGQWFATRLSTKLVLSKQNVSLTTSFQWNSLIAFSTPIAILLESVPWILWEGRKEKRRWGTHDHAGSPLALVRGWPWSERTACSFFAVVLQVCHRDPRFSPADNNVAHI